MLQYIFMNFCQKFLWEFCLWQWNLHYSVFMCKNMPKIKRISVHICFSCPWLMGGGGILCLSFYLLCDSVNLTFQLLNYRYTRWKFHSWWTEGSKSNLCDCIISLSFIKTKVQICHSWMWKQWGHACTSSALQTCLPHLLIFVTLLAFITGSKSFLWGKAFI